VGEWDAVYGHPPKLVAALKGLSPRHIPGYVAVAAFWWAGTFRMLPRLRGPIRSSPHHAFTAFP
jgi:hypothetical protein